MRERDELGHFVAGHTKIGGFVAGSIHTQVSKEKVSSSLRNRFAESSRRWKGEDASYAAKHMWIIQRYGHATQCENPLCRYVNPKRHEWANLSGKHKRDRSDYIQLCPSCHRKMDKKGGLCAP